MLTGLVPNLQVEWCHQVCVSFNYSIMKKILLFAILISAVSVNGQSLKDALYGGKLKTDSGTVIRKTDDLSTKIDTTTKKPVEPEKPKAILVTRDSSGVPIPVTTGDAIAATDATDNSGTPKDNAGAPKDNNALWKDYVTELSTVLKTDVLPSKKIRSGTYSVLIDYEIDVDGQISVNSVSCSPESSYLADQIKERVTLGAPQMTPLLGTNGKPRKAVKKYTMTVSK